MPLLDLDNTEFAPGELASKAFPHAEYQARWQRARSELSRVGIDAMVVTSQHNFEYFVGYRTPAWLIKARPLIVVVPSSGSPFVVASEAHSAEIAADGIVQSLVSYAGFETAATAALIHGLTSHGLASATLGFELGDEQRLGIPLREYEQLVRAFPSARIVDAGEPLWQLRIRKSPHELAYLREAGNITGNAYSQLLSHLRPGWTQSDVYREFGRSLLALGGDGASYLTMTGGSRQYSLRNSWPRDRTFETGELFWMDVGATFRAYFSDYTRCASLGPASPVQRETYRQVHDILDEALEAVRAGVEARAIMAAAQAAAGRCRLTITVSSRIGHGLGLDLTEPPSLTDDEMTVLEPGMALAVEPGVITDHGFYHLEENVVVLDKGYGLLSEPMPAVLPGAGR